MVIDKTAWTVSDETETWTVTGLVGDFVMAHNSLSPMPYVTWRVVGNEVENGNYVETEDEAVKDLIERAGYGG